MSRTFKGKPFEEMTKEELLEALHIMADTVEDLRANIQSQWQMFRELRRTPS